MSSSSVNVASLLSVPCSFTTRLIAQWNFFSMSCDCIAGTESTRWASDISRECNIQEPNESEKRFMSIARSGTMICQQSTRRLLSECVEESRTIATQNRHWSMFHKQGNDHTITSRRAREMLGNMSIPDQAPCAVRRRVLSGCCLLQRHQRE